MILKNGRRFLLLRICLDIILLPVVLILGYSIKFKVGWVFQNWFKLPLGEIYHHAQLEPYLAGLGYLIVLWGISFYYSGVYKQHYYSIMPEVDEVVAIVKGSTLAMILVMALTWVVPFMPGSRFVILYSWFFGIIVFSVAHYFVYRLQLSYYKQGKLTKKAVIIGGNDLGQDLIEKIIVYPSLGVSYIGTICNDLPEKLHFHIQETFQHLGDESSIAVVLERLKPDIIFVCYEIASSIKDQLIQYCNKEKIELDFISQYASYYSGVLSVKDIDGVPFVSHQSLQQWDYTRHVKRIMDIIMALLSGIVFLPVFMIVSLWIKYVSFSGSILYSQKRVTANGNVFNFYKFRTMIPDAEKDTGPVWVSEKNETRYIKGGALLRKYSLDELPQLWNVLKGEMSIVGPRPERPFFVEKLSKTIPYYGLRHRVKGGITGWAQINGRSVLTRNPEHKAKYDLYYIKNWSLLLDIKIILKSILIVFKGEEAY